MAAKIKMLLRALWNVWKNGSDVVFAGYPLLFADNDG